MQLMLVMRCSVAAYSTHGQEICLDENLFDFITFAFDLISGSICSLYHSQYSSTLHRMCLPSIHVISAVAELSHILHTIYELLHSELCQEKVCCIKEG